MVFSFGTTGSSSGTPSVPSAAPAASAQTTGFSFGVTPSAAGTSTVSSAPGTAPSATPSTAGAPAAATQQPGPSLGTAPSTAPTAPATEGDSGARATASATPSTGFSFAAPSTSGNAPSPAPTSSTGGFSSIGAPAPSASPNLGMSANAPANDKEPIATIPPFQTTFPRLEMHLRVTESLDKWKTHSDALNGISSRYGGVDELTFAARELIHLLSCNNATDSASTFNDKHGRSVPIGSYLANPTSILQFSDPDATFRQRLQPQQISQPQNSAFGASSASVTGLFGSVGTQPQQIQPKQQLQQQTQNKEVYITLHDQLTLVTPRICKDVFKLADELHLKEVEALSLYARASEVLGERDMNGNNPNITKFSSSTSSSSMDLDDDKAEGSYDDEDEEFAMVETLIAVGKIGFTDRKKEDKGIKEEEQRVQQTQDHLNSVQRQQSGEEEKTRPSKVIRVAQRLFFQERGALLETVMELIRNRVAAADQVVSQSSSDDDDEGLQARTSEVLVATDQLLEAGLVNNLVKTIREMSSWKDDIGHRLLLAEKEARNEMEVGSDSSTVPTAPGFGGFGATPSTPSTAIKSKNYDMDYAILAFLRLQLHLASECLFFLAYHTQLKSDEVGSIIDLIKDLTNGSLGSPSGMQSKYDGGLPLLNPLEDVPDPYQALLPAGIASTANMPWTQHPQQHHQYHQQKYQQYQQYQQHDELPLYGWNNSLSPMKNAKEWEEELAADLWAKGQPQLLQCVSTLVMTVVCALDAGQVLVNRETHGPNRFGVGNSLFLIHGECNNDNTKSFQSIHARLDPDGSAVESWKRLDVFGFLLIPYALLLRSTLPHSASCRDGSLQSPTRGQIDAQNTFPKCLMAASQYKSLTFARLCLLPSFGMPSSPPIHKEISSTTSVDDASSFDFFIDVLAKSTSQYIDALCSTGSLPITRYEWFDEDFKLAQIEWTEEIQRRQFGQWAGKPVVEDKSGPREVNIMERPDCLEDLFALVSSVCSMYPTCAKAFWTISESATSNEELSSMHKTSLDLVPSRCLRKLDLAQSEKESSYLLVFLSFLASLSLADAPGQNDELNNGASVVHSFLSEERSINSQSERHTPFSWTSVFDAINWFVEKLSPDEGNDVERSSPSERIHRSNPLSSHDMSESSTSYYYGVDNASAAGINNISSSVGNSKQSQSSSQNSVRTDAVKELDDSGVNTLMTLLSLVSNVASLSPAAREYVLSLETGSYFSSSLDILFSLLTTSIPPNIRGMTCIAIANLLKPTPGVKSSTGKKAWELLECCQLVPIKYLSQYSTFSARSGTLAVMANYSEKQTLGNELPPSSFPRKAYYGMIYELEHVEAKMARYPATEGFLYLLTTLIKVAGCPSDIGSQWRIRPGCNPYIEYVTDFLLPRLTGKSKLVKPIPFASFADECRLISRALEVIEAVLVRYIVPPILDNPSLCDLVASHELNMRTAQKELGLSPILSKIFCDVDVIDEDYLSVSTQDFKNVSLNPQDMSLNTDTEGMLESPFGGEPIPLPKSPGFCIMSSILSSNKSLLFQIIQDLLSHNVGPIGEVVLFGERMRPRSLVTALFRETPPSFQSAKKYKDDTRQWQSLDEIKLSMMQSMIEPLQPTVLVSCAERIFSHDIYYDVLANDTVHWRERTVLLSLRILCAALARETAFSKSLKDSSMSFSIVPTLLFKGPIHGSYSHRFIEEKKVNVTRVFQLLTKDLPTSFHGFCRSSELLPLIVEYVGRRASLSDPQGIAKSSFCVVSYITNTMSQDDCIQALCGSNDVNGIRLASSFARGLELGFEKEENDTDIRDAILNLLLSNIGIDAMSHLNLSQMILGLNGARQNCLSVILRMVSDTSFVIDPRTSSSAASCFEVICRIYEGAHDASLSPHHLLLVEKLRKDQFWGQKIIQYLGTQGPSTPSILHIISTSFSLVCNDTKIMKRDNDVLHSISWLLKGLAIEMQSLLGSPSEGEVGFQHNSTKSSLLSAKPHQLMSILNLIFSQPRSLLHVALNDLPLGQSANGLHERLRSGAPSRDLLERLSMPLNGPIDICGKYQVIDVDQMSSHFQKEESELLAGQEWANAWNLFVSRVCACAHVCQAWSDVATSALIFSPLVKLITDQGQETTIINGGSIVELLCNILLRLVSPHFLDALSQSVVLHDESEDTYVGNVESECALPLSLAVLSFCDIIVERYLETYLTAKAGKQVFLCSEEDVTRICSILVGAIASCEQAGASLSHNEERAAVLSCSLSRMLAIPEAGEYCIIPPSDQSNILDLHASAVSYLTRLSSCPVFAKHERYSNPHEAKKGSIALAARTGLSSLFCHINAHLMTDSATDILAEKIFNNSTATAMVHLTQLISADDSNVSFLLQQIALMHTKGIMLLAKLGVTSKLLDCAHQYATEENRYLSSHMGSNGIIQLDPPPTLCSHLSLLGVLLSSKLSSSDRLSLAVDSYDLLKSYSRIGAKIFRSYPKFSMLTRKFVEVLHLAYSSIKRSFNISGLEVALLSQASINEAVLDLERSVLCLTYQLSAYPLPSHILPPLPIGLMSVEKAHASQMNNIAVSLGGNETWWDSISETSRELALPSPPTGSSDAGIHQRFSDTQQKTGFVWSEAKYQWAISSAKCLEVCVIFLMDRIFFFYQRNPSSFSVDAVAIARGLCRCSDASRAIGDRLNIIKSSSEDEVTNTMITIGTTSAPKRTGSALSDVNEIERKYLFELGCSLGKCAERLLSLALKDVQCMLSISSSLTPTRDMVQEWVYFINAIVQALDHTQIESKGVGCAQSSTSMEYSKAIAQTLRQEIEKMKTSPIFR